jgi:hypothetical protein
MTALRNLSPAARALAATPRGCCLWGIGHPSRLPELVPPGARRIASSPRRLSHSLRIRRRISELCMGWRSRSGRARRHDHELPARIWNRQQPGRLACRLTGPSREPDQYGSAQRGFSLVGGFFLVVVVVWWRFGCGEEKWTRY